MIPEDLEDSGRGSGMEAGLDKKALPVVDDAGACRFEALDQGRHLVDKGWRRVGPQGIGGFPYGSRRRKGSV